MCNNILLKCMQAATVILYNISMPRDVIMVTSKIRVLNNVLPIYAMHNLIFILIIFSLNFKCIMTYLRKHPSLIISREMTWINRCVVNKRIFLDISHPSEWALALINFVAATKSLQRAFPCTPGSTSLAFPRTRLFYIITVFVYRDSNKRLLILVYIHTYIHIDTYISLWISHC